MNAKFYGTRGSMRCRPDDRRRRFVTIREWIIVSGDPRISRSPQEQTAWLSAGLTTFPGFSA